jgi:hypothetical protein
MLRPQVGMAVPRAGWRTPEGPPIQRPASRSELLRGTTKALPIGGLIFRVLLIFFRLRS